MNMDMDKQAQKAWEGWVAFTRAMTVAIVATVAGLGLMAFTFL